MKPGKKKMVHSFSVNFEVNKSEFEDCHREDGCTGLFELTLEKDVYYPINALGPTLIPYVLFVKCSECGAAFVPSEYQGFLDRSLSISMILHKGLLNKKQIRFLRIAANFTQEEVAQGIGATDRAYYLKFESSKYEQTMGENLQVRLKLFYAKHYKIENPEQLWAINDLQSSTKVTIEPGNLIPEQAKKELENLVNLHRKKSAPAPKPLRSANG